MQFSVRNCKFQTAEIMGAQSFNFVAKFPPPRVCLISHLAFLDAHFSTKRFSNNFSTSGSNCPFLPLATALLIQRLTISVRMTMI